MTIFSDEVRIPFSIQVDVPSRSGHGMAHRAGLVNHPANGWTPDLKQTRVEAVATGTAVDPLRKADSNVGPVLAKQSFDPVAPGAS